LESSKAAEVFKALGDENRVQIVKLIAKNGEICACNLLDKFDITQPTLSHHMKILKTCGLVKSRKEGRWHHYSIDEKRLGELRRFLESI